MNTLKEISYNFFIDVRDQSLKDLTKISFILLQTLENAQHTVL